jgi:DNA-binding CsgD family transcriptional regulator
MLDANINVFPFRAGAPRAEGSHGYHLPTTGLSSREAEVCTLLSKGMQLKEVATQLSISIHTADCHTRNAYLKLGIHDRGGLARRFAPPNVRVVHDTLTDSTHTTSFQQSSPGKHLARLVTSVEETEASLTPNVRLAKRAAACDIFQTEIRGP